MTQRKLSTWAIWRAKCGRGPVMTTCMHTQTSTHTHTHTHSGFVCIKDGQRKPLAVFICQPFTELKNIMGKMLLRGGWIDVIQRCLVLKPWFGLSWQNTTAHHESQSRDRQKNERKKTECMQLINVFQRKRKTFLHKQQSLKAAKGGLVNVRLIYFYLPSLLKGK